MQTPCPLSDRFSRSAWAGVCLLLALAVGPARAQDGATAAFTFDDNTSCPTVDDEARTRADEYALTPFRREGVECSPGTGVFNSIGWPTQSEPDPGEYVGFSIASGTDDPLRLTSADTLRFSVRRSLPGPIEGEVRYAAVQGGEFRTLGRWSLDGTSLRTFAFALPTLTSGGVVEFRFYGWDAGTDTGSLRFDDVALHLTQLTPSSRDDGALPEQALALGPLFPNPLVSGGGQAEAMLRVGHSQHVHAALYDVLGRRVRTLLDGVMPAGTVALRVEAGGLSSGLYLLHVRGAQGATSQRLLVVH